METIKDIIQRKPEIEISGEKFRLMFNNWALKTSSLKIDLGKLANIASNEALTTIDKINKFVDLGSNAIDLVLAGIKTHIIIECDDLQAIETGLLSEKSTQKIQQLEQILRLGTDTDKLIDLFGICINALVDFMPKAGEKGGASPSSPPRGKVKR